MSNDLILDATTIKAKIRRMAFQILEDHIDEDYLIIAGIAPDGYQFTEHLKDQLQNISSLKIEVCKIEMDKSNPIGSVKSSIPLENFKGHAVVLVDDVLNSGSTLIYAVRHLLQVPIKQFRTAVLVDRSHKKFPVKANYKGISLSTSINESVKVSFKPEMKVELL